MARLFTSDPHFLHRNIVTFCDRPFADVEQMNAEMISRWNAAVSPTDEVWMLGDFAMGNLKDALLIVPQLHGEIHLVPGNHDGCWSGHSKRVFHWVNEYMHAGFIVEPNQVMTHIAGRSVQLCHFPFTGDSQDDNVRFGPHRPVDRGQWLLHGHVHQAWLQQGRMINVGVDRWDFTPVPEEWIAAMIADGPKVLP